MAAVLQYLTMASVNQRKTLDDERQRVGELVQPPREVSREWKHDAIQAFVPYDTLSACVVIINNKVPING